MPDFPPRYHLRIEHQAVNTILETFRDRLVEIKTSNLLHMCQIRARGPNLARSVILIGPRDHIKRAFELARRMYG